MSAPMPTGRSDRAARPRPSPPDRGDPPRRSGAAGGAALLPGAGLRGDAGGAVGRRVPAGPLAGAGLRAGVPRGGRVHLRGGDRGGARDLARSLRLAAAGAVPGLDGGGVPAQPAVASREPRQFRTRTRDRSPRRRPFPAGPGSTPPCCWRRGWRSPGSGSTTWPACAGRRRAPTATTTLSYHLSEVATWIRYGDLRMLRFSMGDPSTPFYPVLGEMASWVLIAPFRDSDVAARWSQLPFALFSFLAVGRDRAPAGALAPGRGARGGRLRRHPPRLPRPRPRRRATTTAPASSPWPESTPRSPWPAAPAPARRSSPAPRWGCCSPPSTSAILFAPVVLALLVLAVLIERRTAEWRTTEWRTDSEPPRKLAGLAGMAVLLAVIAPGDRRLHLPAQRRHPGQPDLPRAGADPRDRDLPGLGRRHGRGAGHLAGVPRSTSGRFLTRQARALRLVFPVHPAAGGAAGAPPGALAAPVDGGADVRAPRRPLPPVPLPDARPPGHPLFPPRRRPRRSGLRLAAGGERSPRLSPARGPAGRRSPGRRPGGPDGRARGRSSPFWRSSRRERSGSSPGNVGDGDVRNGNGSGSEPCDPGRGDGGGPPRWSWSRWRPSGWDGSTAKYQDLKLANLPAPTALEQLAGPDGARVAYAGMNQPYFFFGSRFQNALEIVPRTRDLDARYYRWGQRAGRSLRRNLLPAVAAVARGAGDRPGGDRPLGLGGPGAALDPAPAGRLRARLQGPGGGDLAPGPAAAIAADAPGTRIFDADAESDRTSPSTCAPWSPLPPASASTPARCCSPWPRGEGWATWGWPTARRARPGSWRRRGSPSSARRRRSACSGSSSRCRAGWRGGTSTSSGRR